MRSQPAWLDQAGFFMPPGPATKMPSRFRHAQMAWHALAPPPLFGPA